MHAVSGTENYKVLHVEDRGEALVLKPQGDSSGFSHVDVSLERKRVKELVADPRYRNLVVDLEHANYLGSEMIGYVNSLITTMRDSNRGHVVVNVSADMRSGLAIMKLQELWNVVDDAAVVHHLAPVTLADRIRENAVLIAASVLGAATVAIVTFLLLQPGEDVDAATYGKIADLWREYKGQARQNPNDPRWVNFCKRAQPTVEAMAAQLEETASSKNPGRQQMLYATRDHLPKLIDRERMEPDRDALRMFLESMQKARAALVERGAVGLPVLTEQGLSQPEPEETPADQPEGDGDPESTPGDTGEPTNANPDGEPQAETDSPEKTIAPAEPASDE